MVLEDGMKSLFCCKAILKSTLAKDFQKVFGKCDCERNHARITGIFGNCLLNPFFSTKCLKHPRISSHTIPLADYHSISKAKP